MKKSCSVDGKCPNFSLWFCLLMRGELMSANFRLRMLYAGTIYIRFLIDLKVIYEQLVLQNYSANNNRGHRPGKI